MKTLEKTVQVKKNKKNVAPTKKRVSKKNMDIDIFNLIQTPKEVMLKRKVLYAVNYHQLSFNNVHGSFTIPQSMEFAELDPIEARRQAFAFAKSINTFPDNDPIEFAFDNGDVEESKERQESSLLNSTMRWCTINCMVFDPFNYLMVYNEGSYRNPTIGIIEILAQEYEIYKKLGFAERVETIKIEDRDGNVYEVIAEGNEELLSSPIWYDEDDDTGFNSNS